MGSQRNGSLFYIMGKRVRNTAKQRTLFPIKLEEAEYFYVKTWKHWKEPDLKRYDFVLTDDNWLCAITWIFDNGDFSLCGKWIVTKRHQASNASFRLFDFNRNRIRFNNRVKILINTALLLHDWKAAYRIAYGEEPKTLRYILKALDLGGEDYLLDTLEKQLAVSGVTKDFVIDSFRKMAEGVKVDRDGKTVDDITIKDTTRAQILMMFARWLGLDQEVSRATTQIDYTEVMKRLEP